VTSENGSQTSGMKEGPLPIGLEDVIIFPLVFSVLVANTCLRAAVSILIRILDYAFPIVLQLARLPLFAARILGDGAAAILIVILGYLPISETSRTKMREVVSRNWSWLRHKISYKAFEDAVHRLFEGGMGWVFEKCRNLTPNAALLVIAGAVLWLPVSFGTATAIHAVLLAKAASLPTWMQLLHFPVTFIAKSKLLVLPVYPAAWPQAKRHPLIQAIASGYRDFKRFNVIQKTGYRYRQTESTIVDVMRRLASIVALRYLFNALLDCLNGTVRIVNIARDAIINSVEELSRAWLVGPLVRNFAGRFNVKKQRGAEKPSERMRGFFERWSIKFSPGYYEEISREKAARERPPAQ
jgi:hypothetical protein